jgi:hypothetical protein
MNRLSQVTTFSHPGGGWSCTRQSCTGILVFPSRPSQACRNFNGYYKHVLASNGCCNKLPKTWCLESRETCYTSGLKSEVLKGWAGLSSFWIFQGINYLLVFSSSYRLTPFLGSWAFIFPTYVSWSYSAILLPTFSPAGLRNYTEPTWLLLDNLSNTKLFLKHIVKSLLLFRITHS